jgi:hypothetical protein
MGPCYHRTKRWLRKNYPLPFPVRILLRPPKTMPKQYGAFWWDGERGLIHISDTGHDGHMAETLIEEWVHGMRQATPVRVDYEGEAHDAAFWALYGEVVTRWRKTVL